MKDFELSSEEINKIQAVLDKVMIEWESLQLEFETK